MADFTVKSPSFNKNTNSLHEQWSKSDVPKSCSYSSTKKLLKQLKWKLGQATSYISVGSPRNCNLPFRRLEILLSEKQKQQDPRILLFEKRRNKMKSKNLIFEQYPNRTRSKKNVAF